MYDMALGLDLQNPHAPFRKDVLSHYMRKAAAGMSETPALMEVTFDLGNVTTHLVQRGPLANQSLAELIDSAVIILRAFWGLRATAQPTLAHVGDAPTAPTPRRPPPPIPDRIRQAQITPTAARRS